jgi:hypothetical protein
MDLRAEIVVTAAAYAITSADHRSLERSSGCGVTLPVRDETSGRKP